MQTILETELNEIYPKQTFEDKIRFVLYWNINKQ